jgi:hypothetical protein
VIRKDEVSLRPKPLGMVQVGFRLPAEAVSYYETESETSGRSKVDVVVNALYLDRDLSRRLSHVKQKLELAAASMGLDLRLDLAEILAKLVERGLESVEVEYTRSQKK